MVHPTFADLIQPLVQQLPHNLCEYEVRTGLIFGKTGLEMRIDQLSKTDMLSQ